MFPLTLPTQELLRRAKDAGYAGNKTAFYSLVAGLRPSKATPLVRFEGLPGEFSQHDFGQVHVNFVDGSDDQRVPMERSNRPAASCAHSERPGVRRFDEAVKRVFQAWLMAEALPREPKTEALDEWISEWLVRMKVDRPHG